jgi:hypothetical protein
MLQTLQVTKEGVFTCLFSKSDSSNALASNTSTKLYFPSSVTYIQNITVNLVREKRTKEIELAI